MKYYIFSEIYLILMVNNTTHIETKFKPCPICGHDLSMKDVYVIDDDGGVIEDFESVKDYSEGVEGIWDVTIICPCGYSFRSQKDFDFEDDEWLEEFIADANVRSYTDLTEDEDILESCQDLRIRFYASPEEFDEFYDLYKLWDEHCHDKTLGAVMIEGLKSHLDKMGIDCDGLRHNQNNS